MGLNTQKAMSLKQILHAYVFSDPDKDNPPTDPNTKQSKFSGKHYNTLGKKLFVPSFLISSLDRAESELRGSIDSTWPPNTISQSYIVSAILSLGFENIFKDSDLLITLSELLALHEQVNGLGSDVPEYTYQYLRNLSCMQIPRWPAKIYSNCELIQPRVPKRITNRIYDIVSRYKLDTKNDGGKLIQLCLMKVLYVQPFLREQHQQAMQLCLSEIELALAQQVLQLKYAIKNLNDFCAEWNRLEKSK